jgi:hypothetical protein
MSNGMFEYSSPGPTRKLSYQSRTLCRTHVFGTIILSEASHNSRWATKKISQNKQHTHEILSRFASLSAQNHRTQRTRNEKKRGISTGSISIANFIAKYCKFVCRRERRKGTRRMEKLGEVEFAEF